MKNLVALLLLLAFFGGRIEAQTTWNDTAGDSSWVNASNWSAGAPVTGSNVQIGTMTNGDTVIIDDTSTISLAADNSLLSSLTFNSTLTSTIQILPLSVETFTLNGAVTNSDSHQQQVHVPVIAGASATYAGGTGGLFFSSLDIGSQAIGTTGSVSLAGGNLLLDINSSTSFGTIGSISATGTKIGIDGFYTGHAGDTFQLTSGNFSGATLTALPTLTNGLVWDTSKFQSNGELIVDAVPEPSTAPLLGLAVLALVIAGRRCARRT